MSIENDWLTPTMKETPFYFEGISPEEYEEENKYWKTHFEQYLNRTYKPLWQQRKK